MRVRIFTKNKGKEEVLELEDVIKICDDHGHVIFSETKNENNIIPLPKQKKEPIPFSDDM